MDCRTTPAVNFRTRLGFSQHDPIMTKEQSVLSKITKLFATERTILQHYVLNKYRIDLYFPEHRLAIEIDESNHANKRNDDERENEIKEHLKCKFIRINPDSREFDYINEFTRIKNCIDESKKRI